METKLESCTPLRLFGDSVSIYNTASVYEKTKRLIGGRGKVTPYTPIIRRRWCYIYPLSPSFKTKIAS